MNKGNQKLYLLVKTKLTQSQAGKQNESKASGGNKEMKTKLTNMLREKERKKRKKE